MTNNQIQEEKDEEIIKAFILTNNVCILYFIIKFRVKYYIRH